MPVGFTGLKIDHKTNILMAYDALKGRCVMFGPVDPASGFRYGSVIGVISKTKSH